MNTCISVIKGSQIPSQTPMKFLKISFDQKGESNYYLVEEKQPWDVRVQLAKVEIGPSYGPINSITSKKKKASSLKC